MQGDNYEAVLTSTPVSVAYFHDPNNAKTEANITTEIVNTAGLLRHLATVGSIDVQAKENAKLLEIFKIDDTPAVRFVKQGC